MAERLIRCDDPELTGGYDLVRAWFAPEFVAPPELSSSTSAALAALFELEPDAWLRCMPGRETFAWPGRPEWIVKRFTGGEVRDFWYERVRGVVRSAGRREAENLRGLAADGFLVPRALAWLEEPAARRHPRLGGRNGRSALVMERVPHTETLRGRLTDCLTQEVYAWGARLVDTVARLHRSGWYHRDLYLQHFVLVAGPAGVHGVAEEELALLDVGRARREERPRRRWFVKDLAALWHSRPAGVSRSAGLRFLRGWLQALEQEPGATRGWAEDILAKSDRLAAHAPRHVDHIVQGQSERPPA